VQLINTLQNESRIGLFTRDNKMKHCQAVFLGLIGWYLMLPPASPLNGMPWPDNKAPISHWTIAKSFDTANSCEAALDRNRKGFKQTYHKMSHKNLQSEFWGRFYIAASQQATCIASDDPRLNESAEMGSEMHPSRSN
jgi:hypothetical protein